MSIKKQFLKSKPICKVTFEIASPEANSVSVVGDFNQWNIEEGLLKKQKNGVYKGTFELNKDQSYEFKYVIDGVYVNETSADDYKWNDFANTENSVIKV